MVFLEHKNSEPAMKILMRNIGMTLHVIHKLRAAGIDNVKVNMDWQHLIMNGESLGEYAAMLAAEGLLGHQHANSGWGTFDDDNMVGATAFMETLELAIELRRARYGESGERLGFDLYPYTEDAVGAVRRSVLQWRFIDGVAARIDDAALREAQQRKDAVRGLRARLRGLRGVTVNSSPRDRSFQTDVRAEPARPESWHRKRRQARRVTRLIEWIPGPGSRPRGHRFRSRGRVLHRNNQLSAVEQPVSARSRAAEAASALGSTCASRALDAKAAAGCREPAAHGSDRICCGARPGPGLVCAGLVV